MTGLTIPNWLRALADTLLMPFVILLWALCASGLMALGLGFLAMLGLAVMVPLPLIAWFAFASILGVANFRICFRWLGETPDYRGLPWYALNSVVIVATFWALASAGIN